MDSLIIDKISRSLYIRYRGPFFVILIEEVVFHCVFLSASAILTSFVGALKIKIKIRQASLCTNRIQDPTITSEHPMLTAAIQGGGFFFSSLSLT